MPVSVLCNGNRDPVRVTRRTQPKPSIVHGRCQTASTKLLFVPSGRPELQNGDSALMKDVFSHSHDVLIMGAGDAYERSRYGLPSTSRESIRTAELVMFAANGGVLGEFETTVRI